MSHPDTVLIDPAVQIDQLQSENDHLRNRCHLLGQNVFGLRNELIDLRRQLAVHMAPAPEEAA